MKRKTERETKKWGKEWVSMGNAFLPNTGYIPGVLHTIMHVPGSKAVPAFWCACCCPLCTTCTAIDGLLHLESYKVNHIILKTMCDGGWGEGGGVQWVQWVMRDGGGVQGCNG